MPSLLLFAFITAAAAGSPVIAIDGRFGDWSDVEASLRDPADAPWAEIDFGDVRIAHDDRFVEFLFETGNDVTLQRLRGTARLVLDADGDPETGREVYGVAGADVIVDFTPADPDRRDRPGEGVGLRSTTARNRLSPYDVGIVVAPTHSSDRFELRIRRAAVLPDTAPLFEGERFTMQLVFVDLQGTIQDRTDSVTYELTPVRPPPPAQADDPLARAPHTSLRMMTWNTERGAMLARPDAAGRVLRAIGPDVILLQELPEDSDAGEVAMRLERMLGRPWHVIIGAGGGNLRCAVAAAATLDLSPALGVVAYPDTPQRSVRATGAMLRADRRRMLLISVHLRCCGYAGSSEDRTRSVEADAIRRAVADASAETNTEAIVMGGDLNLVGSAWPLAVIAEGLDRSGEALARADAYRLDGLTNWTWADRDLPFTPGRLDFLLYAPSANATTGSFVFDTRDLESRWLEHHGLHADDAETASDHRPVVADIRWTR